MAAPRTVLPAVWSHPSYSERLVEAIRRVRAASASLLSQVHATWQAHYVFNELAGYELGLEDFQAFVERNPHVFLNGFGQDALRESGQTDVIELLENNGMVRTVKT